MATNTALLVACKPSSQWAPPSPCPSPTPTFSDDDELPFEDCLEELPSSTPSGIALPPELVEEVLRRTQDEFESQDDLRCFSLVSRTWAPAARRILFGQTLSIADEDSVRRLRAAFVSSPQLASHVRRIDLSNASCTWRYQNMHDVFRRVAGILRQTVQLKEISLLQIPLSSKVRGKLFGALQAIRGVETASFYSSSGYHGRGPTTTSTDCPDAAALALLLCRWKQLKSLELSNYAEHPFALSPDALPSHIVPSYHLEELTISSSDLSTSLLWILGNSQHTLRRLHLAATIGLTSDLLLHIFLLLGNSLTDLSLSIDRDDFATPPSDALPGSILAPLVCLETLSVTTDSLFKDDLLEHLGSVEKLQEVMLCFPAFRYAPIQAFLQREPVALRELTLDTWDSGEIWTDHQRFMLASLCESRSIAVFLNGQSASLIEDVWYGEDISEDWRVLEEVTWPSQPATSDDSPSSPVSPSIPW